MTPPTWHVMCEKCGWQAKTNDPFVGRLHRLARHPNTSRLTITCHPLRECVERGCSHRDPPSAARGLAEPPNLGSGGEIESKAVSEDGQPSISRPSAS
jgi:hypothetical protein